jgi:murein DD-endopeptidase MepM/ murein hydrolase activator NlpD
VDISGQEASPIQASFDDKVKRVWTSGVVAGNAIEVTYANGYIVRFFHMVGHVDGLKDGATIKAGQKLTF